MLLRQTDCWSPGLLKPKKTGPLPKSREHMDIGEMNDLDYFLIGKTNKQTTIKTNKS